MKFLTALKSFYIVIYKWLLNSYYSIRTSLRKTDEHKAVFVIYREHTLKGNLKYIYDELKKQTPTIDIHFIYAENKMNIKLFKDVVCFSNARYLIMDDYYLPLYLIKPNKRLKVIQLWHAASSFKKFGHSTVGTKFGPKQSYLKQVPIHANYTHVYVSCERVVPHYAEAFNMSRKNIYPIGIPRIDLFNKETLKREIMNKVYEAYPFLRNTVNILIAPTYRASGTQQETSFTIVETIVNVSQAIKDSDKQIIIKAHPYMNDDELEQLSTCGHVLIDEKYTINEWMLVSDGLITDYSSVIFDYALLKKPLAHFVPDIDEYTENRGFYQDIKAISDGAIIHQTNDLIDWIQERKKKEYLNTSRMIRENFDYTEHISEKIVAHFISHEKE